MRETREEERELALIQTFSAVIESMIHSSESVSYSYHAKSKFEAFRAPSISIRDYLSRIHKFAACSPECFVLALVYIDRLHQMQGILLTDLNVHRVIITSVVVAAKFFDDHYYNNAYYAKVGGVPCSEMNQLEVELLLMINFSLHVNTDTYVHYYNELSNHYIFTSPRHSLAPNVPVNGQFRHYVAPNQQSELVYITEVVPARPLHRSQPPLYPQACHRRAMEELEKSVGSNSTQHFVRQGSRSSGQKRRSAVALGVNA